MCVRKAPHAPLRPVATAAEAILAATIEATLQAAVLTTEAARLPETPRQAQAAARAAATAAEAAAQVREAATVQAVAVAALAVAEATAQAEVAVQAAEEDKKFHLQSNKKTTFAAPLRGSFFIV
jgi:SWI/SNF-related matrix-associated actin-dependent regulator 1 of chromatin subfamily A